MTRQITCDILIIGSGAAGGVLAAGLAQSRDKSVVLLERGGYFTGTSLRQNELAASVLYAGHGNRQSTDGALHVAGGECVGGGTLVNYALAFDPVPSVWRRWRRVAGLHGFSFDSRANDYGVAGLNMVTALADVRSRINVHEAADAEINENNRLFSEGCRARKVSVRRFELNMRGCIGCGFCGTGCMYDRKQSTAITYVPDSIAYGAQLIHHCDVEEIVFDDNGGVPRAVGARAVVRSTLAGSRPNSVLPGSLDISAKLVIVCAGSVETPALLQRSQAPDPFERIGRGLILHPSLPVGGIFDHAISNYRGVTGTFYSDHFSGSHGFMLECLFDHPIDTAVAVPGVGAVHFATMRDYRKLAGFGVMLIDSSNPDNRVRWDTTSDKAQIAYALSDEDKVRLRFGAERAVEIMFAAGAREVFLTSDERLGPFGPPRFTESGQAQHCRTLNFEPHQTLLASAHAQATVKMGEDPRTASVDSRCELHGARNLIACDSSSFPTSCGVNPMISIMTLARYQAKRIAAEWTRYA